MKLLSAIALVMVVVLVGDAHAQVRVEVIRDDVHALLGEGGGPRGITVRAVLPEMLNGKELISAYLWLEVNVMGDGGVGDAGSTGCLAAAPVMDLERRVLGPLGSGVPVRLDKARTVCIDISVIVQEWMRRPSAARELALVPCPDEGGTQSVGISDQGSVAGWFEYSFFDRGKRERLLGR